MSCPFSFELYLSSYVATSIQSALLLPPRSKSLFRVIVQNGGKFSTFDSLWAKEIDVDSITLEPLLIGSEDMTFGGTSSENEWKI